MLLFKEHNSFCVEDAKKWRQMNTKKEMNRKYLNDGLIIERKPIN